MSLVPTPVSTEVFEDAIDLKGAIDVVAPGCQVVVALPASHFPVPHYAPSTISLVAY